MGLCLERTLGCNISIYLQQRKKGNSPRIHMLHQKESSLWFNLGFMLIPRSISVSMVHTLSRIRSQTHYCGFNFSITRITRVGRWIILYKKWHCCIWKRVKISRKWSSEQPSCLQILLLLFSIRSSELLHLCVHEYNIIY